MRDIVARFAMWQQRRASCIYVIQTTDVVAQSYLFPRNSRRNFEIPQLYRRPGSPSVGDGDCSPSQALLEYSDDEENPSPDSGNPVQVFPVSEDEPPGNLFRNWALG